jgi:putative Holliday junction resolvase
MPDTPETILALDFGLRRIGAAIGQTITASASPVGVIRNSPDGPDWSALTRIVDEWQPGRIIVGMPTHADGSPSVIGEHVQLFIADLARFRLQVDTQNERHTSREASELLKWERAMGLRGRIQKGMIDSAAAVLIAERWLHEKNRPARANTE